MLPAWATVILAIGGAMIGALAGVAGSFLAYRGAKLNLTHQEREAWRAQLISAMQATADAWEEYGHFLIQLATDAFEDRTPDQEALEKAENLTMLLGQPLTRVMLLYGQHSPTGMAANKFSKKLADLEAMLGVQSNDPTHFGLVLAETDETFDELMERAHTAIQPPGWHQ